MSLRNPSPRFVAVLGRLPARAAAGGPARVRAHRHTVRTPLRYRLVKPPSSAHWARRHQPPLYATAGGGGPAVLSPHLNLRATRVRSAPEKSLRPAGATPHLAKSPATVARTEAPVVALHSTRRRVTPSMVVVVVVVPRRRDPTPHPPLSSGLYRSAHGVRPARCAAGRAGGGAGGVSRGGGRSGDGQWAGHRVGIGDGVGTRDGH